MARKKEKIHSDSTQGQVKAAQQVDSEVKLPCGVVLRSAEEWELWRQFTHARAPDSWRLMDLIIIAKLVRLEAEIRKLQVLIDDEGYTVFNDKGTKVMNATVTALDSLQRQQLAIIRSLSLGVSGDQGIAANKGGTKAKDKTDLEKIKKKGSVSLLAS